MSLFCEATTAGRSSWEYCAVSALLSGTKAGHIASNVMHAAYTLVLIPIVLTPLPGGQAHSTPT
jgi:Mg/Co/Ni transporter MgtE